MKSFLISLTLLAAITSVPKSFAQKGDELSNKNKEPSVHTLYFGLAGTWGGGLNFPLGTSFLTGFGGGISAGARLAGPFGVGVQANYSSLNDIVSTYIRIPSSLVEYYAKIFVQADNGLGFGLLLGAAHYWGTGVIQSVDVTKFAGGINIFRDWPIVDQFSLGGGVDFKGIFPADGVSGPYIFADVVVTAKLWL